MVCLSESRWGPKISDVISAKRYLTWNTYCNEKRGFGWDWARKNFILTNAVIVKSTITLPLVHILLLFYFKIIFGHIFTFGHLLTSFFSSSFYSKIYFQGSKWFLGIHWSRYTDATNLIPYPNKIIKKSCFAEWMRRVIVLGKPSFTLKINTIWGELRMWLDFTFISFILSFFSL